MKKRVKIVSTLLLLILAAAVFFLLQGTDGETAVYVTNAGKKYHRGSCSALARSKIAVTPEDALRSGYEPCGICKPPALTGAASGAASGTANGAANGAARPGAEQALELYRVNTAGLKTTAAADPARMARAEVVGHVDGDTVRVRIPNPPAGLGAVETIRLLGVDTPETVHPSKPVEKFGKEASDYTKSRLHNRNVLLAFDWDLRDRYGRLLAYIYTMENGAATARCFNAELIREGYAHAYTRFAFQFTEEFRALEQEARREQRGLWGE